VPAASLLPPRDRHRRPRGWKSLAVVAAAAIVVASSLFSGSRAILADFRVAFRDAGPSVFTPRDRMQMDTVRAALPAHASVLLVATADEAWHARLWQRALYPEHTVIVRYEPLRADELKRFRDQYAIHHAISLGGVPPDPGFRSHEDLGMLPGRPARVWFGELAP
jgi:hypothetical protein